MNGISIAASQDVATLHRRISNLERALSQFENLDALVEVQGRGLCRLEIIAKFNGTKKKDPSELGAFWGFYINTKGETYLQGGTVTGGDNSIVVEDIKVLDPATGVGTLKGKMLWLQITGDGLVTQGRLQGVFNLKKAVTGMGTSLPDITLPTKDSAKGKNFYLLLGSWTDKKFMPSQTGHVGISFCPNGGYNINRG